MWRDPKAVRALAVSFCVASGGLLCSPPEAQTIDQLTDVHIGVASPAAITDDGTTAFAGASIDVAGENPLHKHQVYRFDTATGAATRLTDLARGLVPVAIELEVTSLLGVSDDGQRLAFVAHCNPLGTNPNVNPELFVMNSDGTGLAQLTEDSLPNSGSIMRIALAGSGNRIAFVSNSNLTGSNSELFGNLFVIDWNGGNLSQLTDLPLGHIQGISISDDGHRIAFSFNGSFDVDGDGEPENDDFGYEIFTILSDGTQLTQLTDAVDFDSVSPAVSGDGTKIAFQSNADLTGRNNKNNDEIFISNWNGANLTQLSITKIGGQSTPFAANPSITDDDADGSGHWVYFFSNHSQGEINLDVNAEIFRIRSDRDEFEAITDTSFSDGSFVPIVSGDGSRVVFYSLDDIDGTANGVGNGDGSPDLFATDADGSNPLQLTAGLLGLIRDVDLTPDGSKIVFSATADLVGADPDRGGEIYLMNPDGTALSQLTSMFAGEAYSPSICADGSLVAFISDEDYDGTNVDGSDELYLVNGDGSDTRRMTDGPGGKRVGNPRLARSCSFAIYDSNSDELGSNSDGGREIWRAEADGTATLTQLTDDGDGESSSERPRMADSGAWVVFQSTADLGGDGTANAHWQVWRMAANGSSLEQIAAHADFDALEPDISGDGRYIAYSSNADPLGSNPEHNYELYLYDTSTTTTTQLTSTTRGSTGAPDFSNDGSWIYFTTNSDLFESDPDDPYHNARIRVATGELERVGALAGGPVSPAVPGQDGSVSVFVAAGNPILDNYDFSPELFFVRHDDGPVADIGVSGPAPTVLSVPVWLSGPMRYDFIRGDPESLSVTGPGTVGLGPVHCVENDSYDLETAEHPETADPAPGKAFFYLWRGDQGLNVGQGSYGKASDGAERVPGSGDCGT
jgi:Tol biopolymer transport system component